ncbi:1-deoxy-D-xylulose 5-phosphate reductoisomerase [Jeotgalicoccus saudimassiliensis]|uniref:1-deoxy-D-xylulose 5-phosphate reductoisomerase n=1 Tax=Jeotgalicoccus saudimassiliensis TaxID=1461582 RepID=A0A078LWI2_9STAP|nr:1-deoxy-D-xylulose-5-phosphate reductoisomerase [Jeotgalicoccus saudimassiliensis]CDZ99563.1 1-deoxy-D-xylulose 5-phosphate reductoisomerase [Jeotgalicoccus saudimassiliensis]
MTKTISILGVTGSIGTQALDVIKHNPEHFKLGAISAGRNMAKLEEILSDFNPPLVSVQDESAVKELKSKYPEIEFTAGDAGLIEVATYDSSLLLTAILGSVGLRPTLAAIDAGIDIALANKETLVAAGDIVMNRAREKNVQIIPVDSEHSALYQCLKGEDEKEISSLIITASGGSFRELTREALGSVTLKDALNHPNWSMGQKITIDSATMMNKGFEVIEAKHLFDVEISQIKTVLHKESIIHSMVEFIDNSIMAQLGNSDMRTAIQYAFTHPKRIHKNNPLSLDELSQLNFKPMDFDRFKMLKFAYDALEAGGTLPTVMNAANEYAVGEFLAGRIKFLEIEEIVESRMTQHDNIQNPDLETILSLDARYKSNMR